MDNLDDKEKSEDSWCPCDDCEKNYILACSTCDYASPAINDSHDYSAEV